jgi:hypothetical protein
VADKAIWKVTRIAADYWFATKKEAEAFIAGSQPMGCELERVSIGCYLNPQQLVQFIRTNFGSTFHNYGDDE